MTETDVGVVARSRVLQLDGLEILSRAKGGDGRTVVAYAAVFDQQAEINDVDGQYMEQIAPGAFEWTQPSVFYHHGRTLYGTPSELGAVPLGRPVEIKQDKHGLMTVSRYNSSALADSVLASIHNGDAMGMSFTGDFAQSDPSRGPWYSSPGGARTLVTRQRILLREYGPTPYGPASKPAYSGAEIVGVRNQERESITVSGQPQREEASAAAESGVAEPEVEATAPADAVADDPGHGRAAADPEKPYGDVTYADPGYQSDGKKRYPLDTEEHCRAAWSYINQDKNAAKYSPEQLAKIKARIKSAGKKYGIEFSDDNSKSSSSSGGDSAPGTGRAEPHTHPAPIRTRSTSMENDRESMTVEERVARQSEIRARLAELDTEYSGAELPQEARAEWKGLQEEMVVHERSIVDANSRADYLRYVNDNHPEQTERVDNSRAGYAQDTGPGAQYGRSGPAFVQSRDIYDIAAIRNRARNIDEVPVLYREYAQRAVEQARFPGATGQRGAPSKEEAQERVSRLLETIDDEHGTLARRILATGSPLYDRAFGKMLGRQSIAGLTAEESRALSLGTDSAGGYAVPFQLDPTVILTSNGVVNPLRKISRVETITGKEWDGVTSAGVTVSRGTEAQEVGTADPAFAQPTVRTTRVQGWVPFSVELDMSWSAMRTQLTNLLQDAKDVEEATAFATGNGTAPNPSGVVSTLGTASWVDTAGSAAIAAGDIYLLENAMAPRFIANSSIVGSKTIYNKFRALFQAQASAAGDPFARPSGAMGEQFNGYPKYELSTMSTAQGTGALILLQGDFNQFLIVDRVGMGVELVPHVLGSSRRPTGERGIYALWFNNSKILADNAFRLLRVKAT